MKKVQKSIGVLITVMYHKNRTKITITEDKVLTENELAPPPLAMLMNQPRFSKGRTELAVAETLLEIQKDENVDISKLSFDNIKVPKNGSTVSKKSVHSETKRFSFSGATKLFFNQKQGS